MAVSYSKGIKISIHALLAESDFFYLGWADHLIISIHALLAESDAWSQAQARPQSCISIHALLAESDAV